MNKEINNIIICAESNFNVFYQGDTIIDNDKILIFRSYENSDIDGFINYFHDYKIKKIYDAHSDCELYGLKIL